MKLTNQKKRWTEPLDKQQYKKAYLLRKQEEDEAEKELKQYKPDDESDEYYLK